MSKVRDSIEDLRSIATVDDAQTYTADQSHADNVKAKFGNSDALQIYHASGVNRLVATGTGLNINLPDGEDFIVTGSQTNIIRGIATGAVTLYDNGVPKLATTSTGVDVTGEITADGLALGDNQKATFGASDDLQIYHDGGNSIIQDQGAGDLYIMGESSIRLTNNNAVNHYAKFNNGGSVDLYHNNVAKLATTSTGVDVTGTVTSDGLVVNGDSDAITLRAYTSTIALNAGYVSTLSAAYGIESLRLEHNSHKVITTEGYNLPTTLKFHTYTGSASTEKMRITNTGNVGIGTSSPERPLHIASATPYIVFEETDIPQKFSMGSAGGKFFLYDETDAAQRLTVDSNGNVGIGTSSPSTYGVDDADNLVIGQADGNNGLTISSWNASNGTIAFSDTTNATVGQGYLDYDHSNNSMSLGTNSAERMRIDSSGNVGIGTSSPATDLHIKNAGSTQLLLESGNTDTGFLLFGDAADSNIGSVSYNHSDNSMRFETDDAEAMRIDSSGHVGIGESDPSGYWSQANQLVIEEGNCGLTLKSGASGNGRLVFTNTKSTTAGLNDGGLISYGHSGDVMTFQTDGSERLRIDSSGNVLVGTTSISAADDGFRAYSSGQTITTTNGAPAQYLNRRTSDGEIVVFRKDNTTVGSIGSNGSRPYLTNPTYGGLSVADYRINPVNASGAAWNNALDLGAGGSRWKDLYLSSKTLYQAVSGNQHSIGVDANDLIIRSETAASETARFTYSGNLLVGTTSTPNGTSSYGSGFIGSDHGRTQLHMATSDASNLFHIRFYNPNGAVGDIRTNGSSTSYNTSSDYRLKEADVPMTGATERVKALRPINFAWKADGSRVDGFFAHELAEVVPEAATGTKDAMMDEEYEVTPAVVDAEGVETTAAVMGTRSVPDYQGIDQSKLVPLLTATIQELIARIEILESGV